MSSLDVTLYAAIPTSIQGAVESKFDMSSVDLCSVSTLFHIYLCKYAFLTVTGNGIRDTHCSGECLPSLACAGKEQGFLV